MPKEKAATNKVDPSGDQEPQSEEVEAHMEIKRIPWTEEDINMVRDLFQQEIKEECITMERVRENKWPSTFRCHGCQESLPSSSQCVETSRDTICS